MPPLSVSESIIGEKKNVFQSNQNFIITFRLISSLNPISVSDYGATASVDNKLLIELDPGRLEQLTCVRIWLGGVIWSAHLQWASCKSTAALQFSAFTICSLNNSWVNNKKQKNLRTKKKNRSMKRGNDCDLPCKMRGSQESDAQRDRDEETQGNGSRNLEERMGGK